MHVCHQSGDLLLEQQKLVFKCINRLYILVVIVIVIRARVLNCDGIALLSLYVGGTVGIYVVFSDEMFDSSFCLLYPASQL